MAALDLTSKGNFSQKKGVSVASATLTKANFRTVTAADGTKTRDWVTLFRLPENCVVTAMRVSTRKVGTGALAFNSSDYSTELKHDTANAANHGTVTMEVANRVYSAATLIPFDTGTGKKISVQPSALQADGVNPEIVVIVEYAEYTLKTGSFTTYTPGT